ncbi:ArsR/SmtB family transcription factor [Promicromonospora sukumoe]|uniref:ArsR/SmtB family transcription factor n=1 Tax=Promicromonospora sukumoe TaxID=88382 RepID=UPI00365A085F
MVTTPAGTAAGNPAPPVAAFAALGDETRWAVLEALAGADPVGGTAPAGGTALADSTAPADADDRAGLTASALAARLPVTRQAIAKHLAVLEAAGLVESWVVGRERRYRALGAELTALGRRLERIGDAWEARLGRIAGIAEQLERG